MTINLTNFTNFSYQSPDPYSEVLNTCEFTTKLLIEGTAENLNHKSIIMFLSYMSVSYILLSLYEKKKLSIERYNTAVFWNNTIFVTIAIIYATYYLLLVT